MVKKQVGQLASRDPLTNPQSRKYYRVVIEEGKGSFASKLRWVGGVDSKCAFAAGAEKKT